MSTIFRFSGHHQLADNMRLTTYTECHDEINRQTRDHPHRAPGLHTFRIVLRNNPSHFCKTAIQCGHSRIEDQQGCTNHNDALNKIRVNRGYHTAGYTVEH